MTLKVVESQEERKLDIEARYSGRITNAPNP